MKDNLENNEKRSRGFYEEGYKLNMAEFKGSVIQSLKHIEIEQANMRGDIKTLQARVTNIKIISSVMGAVAAIITTIINPFKIK